MKKTGQFLKDKRESAKLSLSEVVLATKINPKVLTAIENGDEKNLPAKTFLKGFIRAYASFLKIDVDEVLRMYQDESGGPAPEVFHEINKPQNAAATSRKRIREENSSGMRTAAIVVIVLLIGVIIGVRELIEKYQREKVVENSVPIKVSPLDQPPVEIKPAEVAPTAGALPAPAPIDAPAAVPAPTAVVETPPPSQVKPVPPTPEEPKPEVKIEKPAVSAEPSSPVASLKNEIILEALDKVDVKFQIKGETKKLSLAPTQVHTIHSDQPVTLELSDGGAVNIILNGRERGVPGDLGKPKQIKIP